jgi:aminopeptidase N
MIEFFSRKLGVDYPWDKYSQIVVRDFVSGAMENTTATVFFDRMNMSAGEYLDENHEDIISHELFHHWFGDLVTAESWSNLPLNESFATYGEYLWEEHKYGRETADLKGMEDLSAYLGGDRKKNPDVIRFDFADREQMFDEISYQKGGRILHMLRKTVGDDAFFKALNLYLTRHSYKNAEIHDLRLAFEEVSGTDLNWFFSQWFLASGHPVLNVQSNYNPDKKEVSLTITQKQDLGKFPLYRIPMAVDVYSDGRVERKDIVLDKQEQTFIFPSAVNPDLVNADAEKYILGEKVENKTLDQYIFQYHHAPLFMDRMEAIMRLLQLKNEASARATLVEGFKDKNYLIRVAALSVFDKLTLDEQKSVYEQVRSIALKDEVSMVRAAAVTVLGKFYGSQNNRDIYEITKKDKAPSVVRATEAIIGK